MLIHSAINLRPYPNAIPIIRLISTITLGLDLPCNVLSMQIIKSENIFIGQVAKYTAPRADDNPIQHVALDVAKCCPPLSAGRWRFLIRCRSPGGHPLCAVLPMICHWKKKGRQEKKSGILAAECRSGRPPLSASLILGKEQENFSFVS